MPVPPQPDAQFGGHTHNHNHQSLILDRNTPTHPQTNQPDGSGLQSRSQSCDFLPRLLLMLVMLFLILSLVTFIAWLVIHPHNPSFRLTSLFIFNITLSNSHFTAAYDIVFTVNNTNKKVNLFIDHVKLDLLYRKSIISGRVLDVNVYVKKMSEGRLTAELAKECSWVHGVKDGPFKALSDEWSKRIISFNVFVVVRIRFTQGVWPSKERYIGVSCIDLPVEFVSTQGTGKLMSGWKDCLVRDI